MVKDKPTKHKDENTFQFQNFSERLSLVNVDIIHRIDLNRNSVPEETDTFFHECLEKWGDLNCTRGYALFCKELGRDVQSLAQLLLHQEHVTELLLTKIDSQNADFLQPILELVVAVSKDLQSEFYPKFPSYFKQLIGLLQTRDPETIELTFTCLAYLYKNLWRTLVKDIENVYELLFPLLSSDKPEYIQQFASESFAFIGRKVSNKTAFIELIFSKLSSNPEDTKGVGQLLFQLVKGVKRQFHSCLGVFLPIYLKFVSAVDGIAKDHPTFRAVEHSFLLMAFHTTDVHSSTLWKHLLDQFGPPNKPNLAVMLLLKQLVTFKEGELVSDSTSVADTLTLLLKEEFGYYEQCCLSESTAALIMSTKANLSLEQTDKLSRLIYSSCWEPKFVLKFSNLVSAHKIFESHLLPHFILFCHKTSEIVKEKHVLLDSLTRLIASKNPIPKNGNEITSNKYPLEFTFAVQKTGNVNGLPKLVENILQQEVEHVLNEEFNSYVCALICYPNIKPVSKSHALNILKKIIGDIARIVESAAQEIAEPQSKRRKTDMPPDFLEKLGFILSLSILSSQHFSDNVPKDLPWEMFESMFMNDVTSHNIFFLRAADFYLTIVHQTGSIDVLTTELMTRVYQGLGHSTSSPNREERLLGLHMLSLFDPPLPIPPENVNPGKLFHICLQAEMVPAGVREYREKLKFLQQLEAERIIYSIPIGGNFSQLPLRYLLSQLFINFRPLWEPVLKLVETHAASLESEQFWTVYFQFLESLKGSEEVQPSELAPELDYLDWCASAERLDFVNVRSLAWQGLSRFGDVENQHSKITPLFLDFWSKEYCSQHGAVIQNLSATHEMEPAPASKDRKTMINLLTPHLSVFATFRRPQQMHREDEVVAIFYQLLSHRVPEVQKKALDCLMAYGSSYLIPYKDNLYRLLEDRSFRHELTLFSIDDASSSVRPEHRSGLTPVLIRILFGRMQNKTGPNSTGKQNIQQRQSLILRYIAGFSDPEIDVFLDLAFHLFRDFNQSGDVYQHVKELMANADPSRSFPLKRIQGALGLMATIFSKLGNLMKSTLPKLLNILLSVSAHVAGLLSKKDLLDAKFIDQLKNLRNLCILRVTQFFSKFERYPWSAVDVEALFHVCVWPHVDMLPIEAIHSPTPLLRLFQVWSENSRYYILFGKCHPEQKERGVLPSLFSLLSGEKAHSSVNSFIMDMVEKLVTSADFGEDHEIEKGVEEIVPIQPDFVIDWEQAVAADKREDTNLGSKLLVPHIPAVLSYLKKNIAHGLSPRDLNVLMRISEFVTQPEQSSELSRLVVPAIRAIANRSSTSASIEETLTQYLNTLANLLKNAQKPHAFIGIFATLFGSVDGRSPRQALSNVLQVICQRDSNLNILGELVSSLNAWDERRVDQPNYELRLATHKQINTILEEGDPSFEWSCLVLYNCFYFVRTEEDTSLKDSSSYSLQQMTSALSKFKFGKALLNDHFLPQLRLLLRSKNEVVRHEGISILSKAVANCSGLNNLLNNMRKLNRKRNAADVETDFFENSRHLQTHRRSRALLRLTGILKNDKQSINGETITQFLLPLTTCYLFSEVYDKHNHLVDASLECLQAMAGCLSWYNYEKLLRFFLSNMTRQTEFQKQAVKAVVAVLNGFHFDLRNSQFKPYYSRKPTDVSPVIEETSVTTPQDDVTTEMDKEADIHELTLDEKEKPDDKNVISVETATKIHSIIVQHLLPQLNGILTARSKREMQHKAAKQDYFPEDDEILRVPIALALVSLLKHLPPGALERSLPGMFSKVTTFLKSRRDSVREVARNTLISMVTTLGPQHLKTLMDGADPILQRGFQVHVYIFTIHSLLVKLVEQGQLVQGSLDPVVHSLVELCKKELYGDTADEKEVAQILSKVKEARGTKAYDTLRIVSEFITQPMLLSLILPMKEILASTKSHKMTRKVEECLQNIATGLSKNQGLAVEPLLIFIQGVIALSMPQLKLPDTFDVNNDKDEESKPLKENCLLLEPAPKRVCAAAAQSAITGVSKSAYRTNSHLLVEFGLLTFNFLLTREKCHENSGTSKVLPMLDPFIPMITNSLNDPHSKLVTLALKCISRLFIIPSLPSIEKSTPRVCSAIFTLLYKYAGSASGEYFEMIQTAFKTITQLVSHVKSHIIDTDQLRVLLTYAEKSLCDHTQQAIGFGVLTAVLKRKLNIPELEEVIHRVSQLSITSEVEPVRDQCRKVVLKYLISYGLGDAKITKILDFFLDQLEYEKDAGRGSAIKFIISVCVTFPLNFVSKEIFRKKVLSTMGARLINETSTVCVKAIAAALRNLIERYSVKTSTAVFKDCMVWLAMPDVSLKRMAVQLFGVFAEAKKVKFECRLTELLPELIKLLELRTDESENRELDLLLIKVNYTLLKIMEHCAVGVKKVELIDVTNELWDRIIQQLKHPHVWIRTLSARLVGTLLGWHNVDDLVAYAANPSHEISPTYLLCPEFAVRLHSLASASLDQLQSEMLDDQLADQVVKNLVFIAKIANRIAPSAQEGDTASSTPTLAWLTGRLRREINAEVKLRPTVPIKRVSAFKWMAAVSGDLYQVSGKEGLTEMVKYFVPPLAREMGDDGAPQEVRNLSQEVAEIIKGLVGTEVYSEALMKANRKLAVRRRERKAVRKADNVTRPELAAKLRMKKQLAKKIARKVKIGKLKGRKPKLGKLAKMEVV